MLIDLPGERLVVVPLGLDNRLQCFWESKAGHEAVIPGLDVERAIPTPSRRDECVLLLISTSKRHESSQGSEAGQDGAVFAHGLLENVDPLWRW